MTMNTDPLLKELKGHILKLVLTKNPPYGDDNEVVFLLCHCIELIFLKGLIRHDGFTPWRADGFSFFYQLVRKYHRIVPLSFKLAFEEVLNDPKTRSQTGKMRLLIRTCLKRKCLFVPVQFHVENEDYDDSSLRVNYHKNGSIIGHEILCQIFLSLIQQLGQYDFNFDLSNSSFLDESWQIPRLVKAEFVPCDKLGLTLGFPMGFAVIVDIIDHSLAAEVSGTIAVGDIMDEFNGTAVRNFYGSKIESLFRKHRSRPFTITFIKATDASGQLYLPAIKLYRILGLDPEKLVYSKASSTPIDHQDEIDLELANDTKPRQEEIPTLYNETFDNNVPVTQDLLPHEVDQMSAPPPKDEHQYHNIMDELVLSSSSIQGPQSPSHALKSNYDLIDIDLNSPVEINWESLIQPELPEHANTGTMGESLRKLEKDNDADPTPTKQESGANSVFQSKYVDDEHPCLA